MNLNRSKETGFLDLNDVIPPRLQNKEYVNFFYEGNEYFFKEPMDDSELYNELIAEEFAKDMGIPCCHNDLGQFGRRYGNISQSEKDKYDTYTPFSALRYKYHAHGSSYSLESIWDTLYCEYKDEKIVKELMDQIVKIFIFDCIIANIDRNTNNLAIVTKDGKPSIYPIFDNSLMANDYGIDDENYYIAADGVGEKNQLTRFLEISSSEYTDMVFDSLKIISPENIEDVFRRVEERLGISLPERVKEDMYSKLKRNLKHIGEVIDKEVSKKGKTA